MKQAVLSQVKAAGPSTPVEMMGLTEVPEAGDTFYEVKNEKMAKHLIERRKRQAREKAINSATKVTLDNLFTQMEQGNLKVLNLIVKADVQGSVEAVKQAMEKLENEEVKVKVIHAAAGAVNQSDVTLAKVSNAIIIAFNVRPDNMAKEMAEKDEVEIKQYSIIYQAIEDVEAAMKVKILRIHIEEDAGKLNHDEYTGGSLVDLNRAGVPLIEIVSEPDLRSSGEADRYLKKLKSILQYIEVSDCKMEEGSLRADVNVSVRKVGDTKLGTRTEMKNMNSFKSITRAIDYEVTRQIDVLEEGGKVEQETLRWDDVSGKTFSMRDKEDAQDYRYFPDPDLVAINLSDEYIEDIKNNLPELPESRKERYINKYHLSEKDANIITSSKYLSDLFEKASEVCGNRKAVNNWIISDISRILNEKELEADQIPFTAEHLGHLVELIDKGTISSSIGKKVIEELFENPKEPEEIIKEKGWIQISDEGEIREVVLKVLEENPNSVADYKAGKDRAIGFLVGQAMKATKGKANPQMLNKMLKKELSK